MQTITHERPVMSVPELAKTFGLAESTTWRNLATGRLPIPTFKIGGSTRVRTSDVYDYLAKVA